MATRQNFTEEQKDSARRTNASWLQSRKVEGIELALAYEPLRLQGLVYWCENCGFCHTDRTWFDVDHFVPDRHWREWGIHADGRLAVNMAVLCKSKVAGDLSCNQSKGGRLYVPRNRGLAYTHRDIDMNWVPLEDRPFPLCGPRT